MVRLLSPIRDDVRYGYAVGRVRVLESRLLTRSVYERLIDAPDFAEQRRVLSDTSFGRYLEGVTGARGVELALDAALADLYDEFLVRSDLPGAVVRFFRISYDYRNLRAALKSRLFGIPLPTLSAVGTIPPEAFSGKTEGLPPAFAGLLATWDAAERAPEIEEVEATIDRAMFADLTAWARESGVPFLRDLARLRVDLANIRVMLRGNRRRMTSARIAALAIPGGSPKLAALLPSAGRLDAAELAEAIVAARAVPGLHEDDLAEVARYDLVAASLEARRMAAARMVPNGPEPVLAYVLAREAETVAVRVAVIGAMSGLDRDALRERLRAVL